MNTEVFTNIISHPEILKDFQVAELKNIIKKYPYFQSARALYLKGLKNNDSYRYNNELKITAAFTTDRSVLFDFITSIHFEKKSDIHKQIKEKIAKNKIANYQEIKLVKEKIIDIGSPIKFDKNETHSFNEWLQLSTYKPINRGKVEKVKTKKDNTDFLINRFIENNPKISSLKKDETIEVVIPKNKADKSLMTETLAKVYLEQKKFSKAIKAYEILSLKYPEKSGFFADQIKGIKKLKKQ
jgi:hypothetical protein